MTEYKINQDIKPYLDDIADKLWSQPSHATIMVGAGFSKNSSNDFPDWNELGDVFYKKIYGEEPTLANTRYANVLKLADGVEAAFGRATLNKMLKTEIPDTAVEPSSLHRDLLSLPWADVFTTNYDTLLERASNLVSSRRYDVVVNTEELVYSNSPRIIKLHGSFPSKTPFIISEEDYRKYPSDFAPFVNTVQQSLLENTLCLIGFSGDDPNFLKWIGWIRDNLGLSNAPKIYLIGLFNFTDAELKLLETKNIIVVNMRKCDITSHWEAMDCFFHYLKEQDNLDYTLNWPALTPSISPIWHNEKEDISTVNKKITNITNQLMLLRTSYPGWIVAPFHARQKIKQYISNWLSYCPPDDGITLTVKALLIKELIWHNEICLLPMFDDFAQQVINIHDELEESVTGNNEINLSLKEQKNIIIHLKFSLAQYYREEYRWNEWNALIQQLNECKKTISADEQQHLNYECCLGHFFKFEFTSLQEQLNSWKPSVHFPIWQIKKAGLVAEFGDLEQATELSQQALLTIREKLNLTPIKDDLSLLSQESYAMMILRFTNTAKDADADDKLGDFNDRWQQLAIYKCDPWKELELLDLSLNNSDGDNYKQNIRVPSFDIGRYRNFQTQGADHNAWKGYNLLRFFEQTGIPVKLQNTNISSKSVAKASRNIINHSPLWAIFFTIRLADNDVMNKHLGRKTLLNTPQTSMNQAAKIYLEAFKSLNNGLSVHKGRIPKNLYDRLATILPDVLSRLLSRLSFKVIESIYSTVCDLFNSGLVFKYQGLEKILERSPNVLNQYQANQLSIQALNCRCPDVHPVDEDKVTPPIWHFDLSVLNISITSNNFEYLLSLANDSNLLKQKWGVLTLAKLYEAKILSKVQSKKLANYLWQNTEKSDLPSHKFLLRSAYLYLPASIEQDIVQQRVKELILSLTIPVRGDSKSYRGIGGDIPFFNELLNSYKSIKLTQGELINILDKLINWWDTDNIHLLDKKPGFFGSTFEEFKARFEKLVDTLCYVILPQLELTLLDDNRKSHIKRLITELNQNKFDTAKLQILGSNILEITDEDMEELITTGMISGDEKSVIDACNALEHWLSVSQCEQQFNCIQSLTYKVLMRSPGGLSYSLQTFHKLIKKYQSRLPKQSITDIVSALIILSQETKLTSEDSESIISDKLLLRKVSCQIAFDLYTADYEQRPPSIEKLVTWKDVCASEGEFNEIKRIWL